MDKIINDIDDNAFEKRADYISDLDISNWNIDTDYLSGFKKDVLNSYAKLFAGPRGTGKTHLFKVCKIEAIKRKNAPLPIFVSFNRYYHLEPLLTKTSNAIQIFHTWVIAKIVIEIYGALELHGVQHLGEEDSIDKARILEFVSTAEKGIYESRYDDVVEKLSIPFTINLLKDVIVRTGRKRAILLLDDAALTLTHDYMVEFFEIFRSLKSNNITPKASVYPGSTQYGPRFHLGQDAEIVYIWKRFDDSQYLDFLDQMTEIRLPDAASTIPKDILQLFKYGSFGVPRAFLSLLQSFSLKSETTTLQAKFNAVIEEHCDLIRSEYLSLAQKMPQYSSIVSTGFDFFEKSISLLKENNSKKESTKNLIIGIDSELNPTQKRMMNFLTEAGLIYRLSSVKHGSKREYERFIPHIAFLIKERVFSDNRGFNASSLVEKISAKDSKHPIRRSLQSLMGQSIMEMSLDLPPCQQCGAVRITESQKFCHQCGAELQNISTFEKCMDLKVEDLPLTKWQKEKIVNETSIKTVRDFLVVADPGSELRKAKMIGEVRSLQIFNTVKKYVEEFLS